MHKQKRTRAYRFSGNTPAFPAQWLYGLCLALPGDEFLFVTIADGLKDRPNPVGSTLLRQLDTSNGCQDHEVLPYATIAGRLHAVIAHGKTRPAIPFHARRCRVHRNPPQRSRRWPTPLRVRRDARRCSGDLPDRLSEMFFRKGMDSQNDEPKTDLPVGSNEEAARARPTDRLTLPSTRRTRSVLPAPTQSAAIPSGC